jgi:hypothetical protein
VIFSPPYPNSFDYTDVYNVELWALGYLGNSDENRSLRLSTISSHVQIQRDFDPAPQGSSTLGQVMAHLSAKRRTLWDARLPEMVGGYFSDMYHIVSSAAAKLTDAGEIWMVVGDSQYGGVPIAVAQILAELASHAGCNVIRNEPFRSMRASAQQGGHPDLAETLLVLGRA